MTMDTVKYYPATKPDGSPKAGVNVIRFSDGIEKSRDYDPFGTLPEDTSLHATEQEIFHSHPDNQQARMAKDRTENQTNPPTP